MYRRLKVEGEEATRGSEQLTDIGDSGSRILDGEEGMDVGVLALPAWLKRAVSRPSAMHVTERNTFATVVWSP
jgi:hypothetical protein